MKVPVSLMILLGAFCIGGAQTRRISPSDMPCADAFSNAMRASFEMGSVYPPRSHQHKRLTEQGFAFSDVALTMYGGDHSQDARLCTKENLRKLESINVFLDAPYTSWDDKQKVEETLKIEQFELTQPSIYASNAEKYLKSR